MKTKYLLTIVMVFITNCLSAQNYTQYFDGADTICDPNTSPSAICITIGNDSTNIWQIGTPKKVIFDASATFPNAILTDTVNFYPPNNTSSFQFEVVPWAPWGILAIQWKQKLDMDKGLDGGKIEFSNDAGATWQNAFNNPYVYNFYGFQLANQDTLPNGDFVFSGTDSVWRDIWLCFSVSWLTGQDTFAVRFTFTSDSLDNSKEGWMIDNMMAHLTAIHTISEVKQEQYLSVSPNPASDIIHIQIQKIQAYHIIEQMVLVNSIGQTVEEWKNIPTKFFINAQKYDNGMYFLKIKTNIQSETVPIVINHN